MMKLLKFAAAAAAGYSIGRVVEAKRSGVALDRAFKLESIFKPIRDLAAVDVIQSGPPRLSIVANGNADQDPSIINGPS